MRFILLLADRTWDIGCPRSSTGKVSDAIVYAKLTSTDPKCPVYKASRSFVNSWKKPALFGL
jgi:hypothetical protein